MKVKDRFFGVIFCLYSVKVVFCSLEYCCVLWMYINECREKLRKIVIVLILDEIILCIYYKLFI